MCYFQLIMLPRWVKTKKVEHPDVAMGIHPGLHAEGVFEFWEPTLDLLMEENILTVFTVFNTEEFNASLKRLDGMFARYKYKVNHRIVSINVFIHVIVPAGNPLI